MEGLFLFKTMPEEINQFIDKTNDRKYFTITPNIIINGYDAKTSGVYSYMKMRAGENGQFYESQEKSSKKLNIDRKTLRKIYQRLEKNERIKCVGAKVIKTHPVKVYEITDIWRENIQNYEKRNEEKTPASSKAQKRSEENTPIRNEEKTPTNKNLYKKEPNSMSAKPTDWQLEKEIEKLLRDQRRHIQVIGVWIKEKGLRPENAEQMQSLIKRNLRPARLLNGYTNEDIHETVAVIKNTEYLRKFTLETVAKYIDEVVAQKKKQGRKIIRFEEVKKPDGNVVMRPIYEEPKHEL